MTKSCTHPQNVEKIGDGQELGHKKEGYDKLFDTDVISFLADEPFIIKHKVKITDVSKAVTGYLTYMTCDNEKCLPPVDVDFSFKFNFKEPIKVQKGEYDIKVPDEVKKQIDKSNVKKQLQEDLKQNKQKVNRWCTHFKTNRFKAMVERTGKSPCHEKKTEKTD